MKEFIKESLNNNQLYISKDTLNCIIEKFKYNIIKHKDAYIKLKQIDEEVCEQITDINIILNILELYKNSNVVSRSDKEIITISYYGTPYITVNALIQALIQKKAVMLIIEDSMLGINKLLVDIFNNILKEYKISKIAELYNLPQIEDIISIQENIQENICIGDSYTFYKYKKNGIRDVKFIPFKNMAIYCEDDKYLNIQRDLYNYAEANGIEAEIYYDISLEEFIDCVNIDDVLENVVVFTQDAISKEIIKQKVKNRKIYINKNPFQNETFKISI